MRFINYHLHVTRGHSWELLQPSCHRLCHEWDDPWVMSEKTHESRMRTHMWVTNESPALDHPTIDFVTNEKTRESWVKGHMSHEWEDTCGSRMSHRHLIIPPSTVCVWHDTYIRVTWLVRRWMTRFIHRNEYEWFSVSRLLFDLSQFIQYCKWKWEPARLKNWYECPTSLCEKSICFIHLNEKSIWI